MAKLHTSEHFTRQNLGVLERQSSNFVNDYEMDSNPKLEVNHTWDSFHGFSTLILSWQCQRPQNIAMHRSKDLWGVFITESSACLPTLEDGPMQGASTIFLVFSWHLKNSCCAVGLQLQRLAIPTYQRWMPVCQMSGKTLGPASLISGWWGQGPWILCIIQNPRPGSLS